MQLREEVVTFTAGAFAFQSFSPKAEGKVQTLRPDCLAAQPGVTLLRRPGNPKSKDIFRPLGYSLC